MKNTQKTSKFNWVQWVMFGGVMGILVLSFLTWNNTRFRPACKGDCKKPAMKQPMKHQHGPKAPKAHP